MATPTEELIQTGRDHLGRFAFHKRENPFVSSRAALELRSSLASQLEKLLEGEIDPSTWLEEGDGAALLRTIKIGLVPREAKLIVEDGKLVAGVESVHGFLQAHLFWWLVSILWTIAMAREVDPLLGDGIKGSRFHRTFLEDPNSSGVMFRNRARAYKRWKEFPTEVAAENKGKILGANTLDIKAFYYSIDATPRAILNKFFASKGDRAPQTRHAQVLTVLLGAVHERYARRCAEVQPRKSDLGREGRAPFPVGLPSSEALGNMVMSLALDDICGKETTLAATAYADDLIVMTRSLSELEEDPSAYFARLGLCSAEDPYVLQSESLEGIASLQLRLDKCEVSYSRHSEGEGDQDDEGGDDEAPDPMEEGISENNWDPYIEGDTSPDWGGRLRTVLRAPHRRERVPKELKDEILRLIDEIRVGLSPEEVRARFDKLVDDLDHGHLLSLQPYWSELLVIGMVSHGPAIIDVLTEEMRGVIDSVLLSEESTTAAKDALEFGLRASWIQALAQSIAVSTDAVERQLLLLTTPELDLPPRPAKTKPIIEYAMRLRKRRLIPNSLVAAPLAEFTEWEGRLIGPGAFSDFIEWFRDLHPTGDVEGLAEEVGRAVRFVPLHEACLAIHLWAGRSVKDWLAEAFAVLGGQPLIQRDLVEDLLIKAEEHLDPSNRKAGDGKQQLVRMAMPSIQVNEEQLKKIIEEDHLALGKIAQGSRAAVQQIVEAATSNAVRLLVLPEWAVVPQQLPWVLEKARLSQMLVIAGQTPEVVAGKYRNWLWTGIPLTDKARHLACLVPPPRQKLFLSPKEASLIESKGLEAAQSSEAVDVYCWRGMLVASLVCYEFADIGIRKRLRFNADIITVSSLNHDWRYFDAVQDATTRDNYCLTVCVNTGAFPGTRITRPTSSEMAVVASVHGSDDPALITRRIDVTPIVIAQLNQCEPAEAGAPSPLDGIALKAYKPFPPV